MRNGRLEECAGFARGGDYQLTNLHRCGPAIVSFNDFIRGSYLDPKVAGAFHDVYEANLQVLRGACVVRRCQQIKSDPRLAAAVSAAALAPYRPEPL